MQLFPEIYAVLEAGGENAYNLHFPNGGSFSDKYRELIGFVKTLTKGTRNKYIIVSHSGSLRMLEAILRDKNPTQLLLPSLGQKHHQIVYIDTVTKAKELLEVT